MTRRLVTEDRRSWRPRGTLTAILEATSSRRPPRRSSKPGKRLRRRRTTTTVFWTSWAPAPILRRCTCTHTLTLVCTPALSEVVLSLSAKGKGRSSRTARPAVAWFSLSSAGGGGDLSEEAALRRRLQQSSHHHHDDSERDGSDSSCSESTAFRPAGATSPKELAPGPSSGGDYPAPNISVGPPIHPPPHLLPYLYPHGLYPGAAGGHPLLAPGPPLSLFAGASPAAQHPAGLLFNAQLALAAQHPALFGHYSALHHPHAAAGGGALHHSLKAGGRFAPYSLPGNSVGSAFETVTPGGSGAGSPKAPPPPPPQPSPPHPASSPEHAPSTPTVSTTATASELKSIEKMVNGLEVKPRSGDASPKCDDKL